MASVATDKLSPAQVDGYLRRLGHEPSSVRSRKPDLSLLNELQESHLKAVPFDTSMNHLDLDAAPSAETHITLGGGPHSSYNIQEAFENIVTRRRGGTCFYTNGAWCALLRGLGFEAHKVPARVFMIWNADPEQVGWDHWGPMGHLCVLVDLDDGRYLSDVGFGGACCLRAHRLQCDQITEGPLPHEQYKFTQGSVPGIDDHHHGEQWLLWRRFEPLAPHWSPTYQINLMSLADVDWQILNFWYTQSPVAPFGQSLIVSQFLPSGDRQVLIYDKKMRAEGKDKALYYIRSCETGKPTRQEEVDLTVETIKRFLASKFGYLTAV